ncbi:hypothetical protein [Ruminococcus sp.]|uniref:hypothetical protein n=1 Tax=Ruminococcus sp. TaxID=41978 RepID=UPI0025E4A23C|nr:hypothetical protein [Ruminococcus sp.]MBQ8966367.1 hypothetical protein [Ruminococcus sp.]
MKQDSKTIRELYAKYQKPHMTRAERQELMEKIYRERYKDDPRKPVSQRGQALMNLICGVIIFAMAMLMTLGIKADNIPSSVPLAAIVLFMAVMGYFEVRHKKEPADELSKELMLKATSYSAYAMIITVWALGFITTLISNKRGEEFIRVNSDNLMGLTMLLLGVYLIVRNAAYLLLDKAPAEDEEE